MKSIINQAISAAINAGIQILDIYKEQQTDLLLKTKEDNSPLTIADKKSHDTIVSQLSSTNFPILSEEGEITPYKERKLWKSFWIVDPLDGTKEFIKRNGEFTVNIALINEGILELGIIYAPVLKSLYLGSKQYGAWKLENVESVCNLDYILKNAHKLPLSKQSDSYRIVGSRSHMNEETEAHINKLKKDYSEIEIIPKGSSLKICMVAEGVAEEYPRFGPTMEWDTAAGHAIANAAGKKLWLTDFSGELRYNKEDLLNPHFIVR